MKKLCILITAIGVLAGCAGRNVELTTLSEQLNYPEGLSERYTADQKWWKAYNDPELDRLVELALENNADLGQSAINITIALYNANLAGYDRYPTLNGSLGASTGRELYTGDDFSNTFSGELGLSYELDILRKAGKAADIKVLEYHATEFDWESARLTLINSVVDIYYNMAYLQGALKIAEENKANIGRLYEIAEAKYNAGRTDNLNVMQARQSLISAEENVLSIRNEIRNNEQNLRNLLNLAPADALVVNPVDMAAVSPLEPDIDVPLEVLAARPDLKAAELRLEQSFKNIDIQQSSWYPTISLRTAVSSSSDDVGTMFDFPMLVGSLSISLPFLQWNTVRTNIKISETEYKSSLLGFESSINTALNEVAYYYYAYGISKNSYENSISKNEIDRKLREYYATRYEAGSNELADLLSAVNTENDSRRDMLNGIYQLIKYENMIYKAMAGRYQSL